MPRILTLIILAICTVSSQAKLNPESRIRLLAAAYSHSRTEDGDTTKYRPLILQVDADSTQQHLRDMGVLIYHHRDNLLLTSVPKALLDSVLGLDGVINAATCGILNENLDIARPFADVDAVQTGTQGLPCPYNGTGVVTGFTDIGFDSKHIAFEGRIGAIYDYNTPMGIVRSATTADEIAQWTTDSPDNYHATHVANIMSGGYMGNAYYGVATGAEIVATTSLLHDVGILSGVEDIIAYAKGKNKPAVINMSLSSFLGPHDGTDLVCQYLSKCAQDAIICISAGNSGHIPGFATQDLSDGQARVMVSSWVGTPFEVSGYTDIWSYGPQAFEFSIEVFDNDSKQAVYHSQWVGPEEYLIIDNANEEWGRYMSGRIIAYGELSTLNDRYNLSVMYDTKTEEPSTSGKGCKYYTCLAIRQPEDYTGSISIDMFADASKSFFIKVPGSHVKVNSDGSINDLCTAPGVLSIGMANSRNTAPRIPEGVITWNTAVNEVSKYTSYSDTPMIEPLPHFAAPGSYLVSAMSSQYIATHPDIMTELSAESAVDGKQYYWYAASGTSMSSPLVAGIIALWLEADPTLTAERAKEIARSTARTDFKDIDNPRWGAGCIDALAGLRKILDETGQTDIHMPVSVAVDSDGHLILTGVEYKDIRLYHLSGIEADPLSALSPGLYIVYNIKDGNIGKVMVR